MLHILLGILKILGILLLALILVLLLLFLAVLFVPLRYRVKAAFHESIQGCAEATFFFHLIHVRAEYRDKKVRFTVKAAGHTLLKNGAEDALEEDEAEDLSEEYGEAEEAAQPERDMEPEEADGPEEYTEPERAGQGASAEPQSDAEPAQNAEVSAELQKSTKPAQCTGPAQNTGQEECGETEADIEPKEEAHRTGCAGADTPNEVEESDEKPTRRKTPFGRFREKTASLCRQIKAFFSGIAGVLRRIKQTAEKIRTQIDRYRRFWHLEATREAVRHVKKELRYLLRHFCPRKLDGDLLFGMEDPAVTGQVLGGIYAVQGLLGSRLQVEADFERQVLEGEICLQGHVRSCHLVKAALALLIDKNIRITVKRFLKMIKE